MQRGVSTGKFENEPNWRRLALLFALAVAAPMLCMASRAEAQQQAGLSIETGSPDALCPELESTRAAVRRRLGELIMPGGSSGYRARYTIGHAPVGTRRDFVRLELFGPEGERQLERDLPLEGESCSTMAEVIALVLDRYFRALLAREPTGEARTEQAVPGEPAPGVPGEPVPAGSGAAPSPAQQPLGPATPPAPGLAAPSASEPPSGPALAGDPRLDLLAFELAWGSPAIAALGVRGTFETWPQVYVGGALHVALLSEAEDLGGGGEVSSREATLRAYVGWGPELGTVRTYVGPGLCLELARGKRTDLEGSAARYRALWAAGIDAGAVWVTDERWSFGAAAALDVSFAELGGRFYAEGREVLEPNTVRVWLGMSVGHAF